MQQPKQMQERLSDVAGNPGGTSMNDKSLLEISSLWLVYI